MPCGWLILKTVLPIIEKFDRSMDDNNIPILMPAYRFQWEEAQNCHILLYPEGMIKLNPSASEILKYCDGNHSVSAILNLLQQQYPEANLEEDVREFLETAHENGWIRTAT